MLECEGLNLRSASRSQKGVTSPPAVTAPSPSPASPGLFVASFFLVFFNTYSGLLSINEELVRLARLMGASWPQTVMRVILPAAAPQIFLGLRTAVPYAVIGAVIGEYIGASEGLGYFILYASQTYDAPSLFAGIVILVAIVFLANFCLNRLEGRVIRWRKAAGQTVQDLGLGT